MGLLLCVGLGAGPGAGGAWGADREQELEGLREAIQGARERVTAHEADERALLERLEEVDKRLRSVSEERDAARRELGRARSRLEEVEPRLEDAERSLARTRRALGARAAALYRAGELGALRVLFSSESLTDMLTRASTLRLLVRHDAELVARFGEERDVLDALRIESSRAVEEAAVARDRLNGLATQLSAERQGKRRILARVRNDRTSERRLLVELEQAAQALEETIRTLGARAKRDGSGVGGVGLAARKGTLEPPVDAAISERFGRVVDPEFRTQTFRSGVDFEAEAGTPVRCIAPGVVRFAGWFRGYGRIVIVDHGDEFHTISGHLDDILVQVDQRVEEGESLGTVGETGSLLGPSLYFEVRQGGAAVDPEPWLLDRRG